MADLWSFLDGSYLTSFPQVSFFSIKPLVAVGVKFDKFSTLSYKGPKVTLATEREREMERERERRKK